MGIITQYSRIQHHTLTTTGNTFSVPVTEDFTSGQWTKTDLAQSEIGVDQANNKAFIRIGSNINEINLGTGSTSSTLWSGGTGAYSIKQINPSAPIEASGDYSVAMNFGTKAIGDYSVSIGESTKASGIRSFCGGVFGEASGSDSFVFGNSSSATSATTIVLGDNIIGTEANTVYVPSLHLENPLGYLLLNRITTTDRNALTAVNGMIIYNTTDNKFQGYENGSWVNLI